MPFLNLRGNRLLAAATVAAGMGFILFGYDNGVLGSVVTAPSFEQEFNNPDASLIGTITAMFELGCIIGAWSVCFWGEPFGRKRVIHAGTITVCIGAAIQTSSYSVGQLIAGRIVAGIGMGFITSSVPVWQAEISPPSIRGASICLSLSFVLLGQLIAYWSEYGTSNYSSSFSWRFPFALQAVLAILASILILFMPESPRWLFIHSRDEEALEALHCLRDTSGDDTTATSEAYDIRAAIVYEHSVQRGWRDLFKEDNVGSRWRIALSVGVQSMQPFSGSAVISYYQTFIFEDSVGMSHHTAQLVSGCLSTWFLFASFLTPYLIERFGRRPLFLIFCIAMAIAMAVMAAMVEVDTYASGIIAAASIFLYEAFFTWGWQGNLWCFSAEILPLEHRSKAMGFAVGCQWIWNFTMIYVTPVGIANIGWKMYIVFAVFNLCFFPIIYFFLPETAGLSLELLDAVFMDKSANPVRTAASLRRKIRRGEVISVREELHRGAGDKTQEAADVPAVQTVESVPV